MDSTELNNILNVLATRFGTTVDHLYDALILQAQISGISDLIIWALLLLASHKCIKLRNSESLNTELFAFFYVSAAVILVMVWMIAIFSISNTIGSLINPNYWVIDRVLSMGKK